MRTVPGYRDVHTGDADQDVRQLNGNLHQLGYDADAHVHIDPSDNDFTFKTEKALEGAPAQRLPCRPLPSSGCCLVEGA